jgi:hypothetical protein
MVAGGGADQREDLGQQRQQRLQVLLHGLCDGGRGGVCVLVEGWVGVVGWGGG